MFPFLPAVLAALPTGPGAAVALLAAAAAYAQLTDADHAQVCMLITAAESSGNFNREVVGIDAQEAVVDAAPAGKPFGSKQLKGHSRAAATTTRPTPARHWSPRACSPSRRTQSSAS